MISISIIVPVYNAEKTLKKCIECLIQQEFSIKKYEIILVNDCSTDASSAIYSSFERENLSIYELQKNGGPSAARNFGAQKAKYDYLAFIDSDAFADKRWLQNISNCILKNKIVACGGMVDNNNTEYLSNINHIIEFSEFYSNKEKFIRTIPSVNLIYKKTIFNELNGFDENLKIGEDSDLNHRLGKLGFNLFYDPKIKVYHATQNNFFHSLRKQFYFGENSFKYRKKNPDSNYQFVFNKPLFIIAVPVYISFNIFLYLRRRYFYKSLIYSIVGLPLIIVLRTAFWLGVGKYLFITNKTTDEK